MTAAIDASRALGALLLMSLLTALGAAPALADTPQPVITQPIAGSWTKLQTLTFSGTSNDELDPLTLRIYAGPAAEGAAVQVLQTPLPPIGESWILEAETALGPGVYTAVAEQVSAESEPGLSAPVTFTVDTVAPEPSLVSPGGLTSDSTPTLHGSAGTVSGDLPAISLLVHEGPTTAGSIVAEAGPEAHSGAWSQTLAALADGTYTVQAFQSDQAGNVGSSEPVTFTIDATPPLPGLSLPSYGSVLTVSRPGFSGVAATAPGDEPSVALDIYAVGPGRSETLVESLGPLVVTAGAWSTPGAGNALPDGIYTAVVRQSDEAGNTGLSEPLLFVIEARTPTEPQTTVPPAEPAPSPPARAAWRLRRRPPPNGSNPSPWCGSPALRPEPARGSRSSGWLRPWGHGSR